MSLTANEIRRSLTRQRVRVGCYDNERARGADGDFDVLSQRGDKISLRSGPGCRLSLNRRGQESLRITPKRRLIDARHPHLKCEMWGTRKARSEAPSKVERRDVMLRISRGIR
jgi:hypothetical protein